ncbi:zincin-like metallopeptidase domain-containing protein [Amaricoccus sp.]|uniref:zincin-like metallopeptidase domain-containing protein n=1 Tax=Amaricoccus sp. TaxID=1872485 RepID=UPI002D1FA0BE|nr:zincin-like metallopeptidase domain-containing protein [Amaricoccus sp.]
MRIIGFAAQAVVTLGALLTIGVPASATEALRRDTEIIGVASVIDGDTLEIHDRRIRLGLTPDFEQSAAYVESWLKALKEDKRAIFRAAAEGQKAADLLLALAGDNEKEAAA